LELQPQVEIITACNPITSAFPNGPFFFLENHKTPGVSYGKIFRGQFATPCAPSFVQNGSWMGFALFLYTPEGKGHLWWELGASSCFETFRIANVRKRMITFEGLSSNANHQPKPPPKK